MLIVDDEPQLLELAKLFLEKSKEFRADTALSADEAADKIGNSVYDAIICDYQMPQTDGLQFLKMLRGQGCNIPFILFTGKGREDVAIEALNSGADFYLQKGGDPRSQFAELRNMVKSSVAALEAKSKIEENERLFRLLAENARDLIFRFSLVPEPHFEYVSPSSTNLTGYTPEEHYANPMLGIEIVHPDDRHIIEKMMKQPEDAGAPTTLRWVRKDGKVIWTDLRLVPIVENGKVVALEGISRDVTEMKEAEEALRGSEERYRTIFENTGSAMLIVEEDGTISLVNSEFVRVTGYAESEVEGKMSWVDYLLPPDSKRLQELHKLRMKSPEDAPRNYTFLAKDKFGSVKSFLATSALIPGTKKTVVSLIDETERRHYEDAMLQVSRKIELLSTITRHDILNQLSVLSGYLQLAKEHELEPTLARALDKAELASASIKRHLEFARDYQNMGTKKPLWIDVRAACRRAASALQLGNVTLTVELSDLEVFGDPMLEKVFYNLIDNAIRHGEKVNEIRFHYDLQKDGMRLICENDGAGIPESEKRSIFDRSALDGTGTRGYGLYLAREILAITDISISETGDPDSGARFEMLIPRGRFRTKTDRKRKSKQQTL